VEVKNFKTLDQQIELLKDRGCIIEDEVLAKKVLSAVNYYRFSSYFLPFKQDDETYKTGTTFNKVYQNYIFDRKLRNLISYLIEGIEVALKTLIAYHHSSKYGSLGYFDPKNYNDRFDEEAFKENIDKYIRRNSKHPVIIHHNEKYDGKYPFWVMIEFYDFGDMSKLFSQLTTDLQKTVAKDLNQNYATVASWLYCLTHLRNSCAHYSRLYNTKMIAIPRTPLNYPIKLNKMIFSYVLVLKELTLNFDDWTDFRDKLKLLISEYGANIDISRLGFPSNWKSYL